VPNFVKISHPLRRYVDFSNIQDGRHRHLLTFLNRKILFADGMQTDETHEHAKFHQNRSIRCEDIKIFRFFVMAAAAILNF